jgi:hypothetical protein
MHRLSTNIKEVMKFQRGVIIKMMLGYKNRSLKFQTFNLISSFLEMLGFHRHMITNSLMISDMGCYRGCLDLAHHRWRPRDMQCQIPHHPSHSPGQLCDKNEIDVI